MFSSWYGEMSFHYSDVIMDTMASQITSLTIVYSTAFVLEIHRWPVNSPHKWLVTRKMFRFDDVIILVYTLDHLIAQLQPKMLSLRELFLWNMTKLLRRKWLNRIVLLGEIVTCISIMLWVRWDLTHASYVILPIHNNIIAYFYQMICWHIKVSLIFSKVSIYTSRH